LKEFILKLIRGIDRKDIPREYIPLVDDLVRHKIIKIDGKIYKISSKYRVGQIDMAKNGLGFLVQLGFKGKDLLIEPRDLNGAGRGDLVVARRIFGGGRPRGKVVYILERAFRYTVASFDKERLLFLNVKNGQPVPVVATKRSLRELPERSVVKIDNESQMIIDVLGVLDDPLVDERISLALYNRREEFSKEAELEASAYPDYIDRELYPDRVDLTHLPFCTIDPPTARDHDDGIYWDREERVLYVAIADVSEYVHYMGAIDREAKERGFTIYFPHKAVPMLPRRLSEGICSLKEGVERLAFVIKIRLDENLEPLEEEIFDGIIRSRRRYSYDRIDQFLAGEMEGIDKIDREIIDYLLPFYRVTQELRRRRLERGFEFLNPEIRLILDEKQELVATEVERETPSHALIEEAMLLANKAAARPFEYGIFRTHEEPSMEKIEELLDELANVGIFTKEYNDIHELFLHIQREADRLGIKEHVDRLLIKTQKQAGYTAENIGHFGLGFEKYTHFTSPIRRYSDLTLHRLLKAKIRNDGRQLDYILRNIEALTVKISELEREVAKVEWDFMDRKFARWAAKNVGGEFQAVIVDPQATPVGNIDDEIVGPRIFLPFDRGRVELFDRVLVRIEEADLATTRITARVIEIVERIGDVQEGI